MTTAETLSGVLREVFEDDSIVATPEMTADDVDGWDSLSHINVILAVESKFRIRFTPKEVLGFKNVGDMMKCIESKTQG
ncbi:MAG: acyl carrier protein [Armatimonadia bacterium]